jgi:hypothetical protein
MTVMIMGCGVSDTCPVDNIKDPKDPYSFFMNEIERFYAPEMNYIIDLYKLPIPKVPLPITKDNYTFAQNIPTFAPKSAFMNFFGGHSLTGFTSQGDSCMIQKGRPYCA